MGDGTGAPGLVGVSINRPRSNGVAVSANLAGGAEYQPTDTSLVVLDMLEKELATAKAGFNKIVNTELPAFNQTMVGKIAAIKDK